MVDARAKEANSDAFSLTHLFRTVKTYLLRLCRYLDCEAMLEMQMHLNNVRVQRENQRKQKRVEALDQHALMRTTPVEKVVSQLAQQAVAKALKANAKSSAAQSSNSSMSTPAKSDRQSSSASPSCDSSANSSSTSKKGKQKKNKKGKRKTQRRTTVLVSRLNSVAARRTRAVQIVADPRANLLRISVLRSRPIDVSQRPAEAVRIAETQGTSTEASAARSARA